MIKTEIGYTKVDAIVVREMDLAKDIIGRFDFVEMLLLTTVGRKPTPQEKNMINALLVVSLDHGLTPSALSARLTYLGAPEALQGAVAAGLLGAGSVFLGTTQNAAEMLIEAGAELPEDADDDEVASAARALVERMRAARKPIYGLGHNIHVSGDPRVNALRELSRENGFYGRHWRLMDAIGTAMQEKLGRALPMNAVAASASMIADLGLDPLLGRGIVMTGRCAGLVGHVLEERESPIALQLWDLVLDQDPRNERPQRTSR
jgi:citrate synthase